MVQERLVKYVLRYIEKGFSSDRIAKRLIKDGWSRREVQEAFKVAQEELKYPAYSKQSDSTEGEFNRKRASRDGSVKKKPKISTWKKRAVVILSLIVLLAIAVLTALWIFS